MGTIVVRLVVLGLIIVMGGYALKWFALSPVCESSQAIGEYVETGAEAGRTILAPPSPKTKLPVRRTAEPDEPRHVTILFACQVAQTQLFWPSPSELVQRIETYIYAN